MKPKLSYFFILFLMTSCIGVDHIDDPIVGAKISIEPKLAALMPDQTTTLTAEYYDEYGIKQDVELIWTSSDPAVATVDQNGLVTGKSFGQAIIQASFDGISSPQVTINVVLDEDDVATVGISSPKTILVKDEMVTLTVVVKNILGEELPGHTAEWFAENESIVAVNSATGKVTGISNGIGAVHAKVDGVKSNSIEFMVGTGRTGTFVSAGGYKAVGKAFMEFSGGKLTVTLSNDFETSYALGTYIYLANTTSGSGVRANGLELMQIKADGAHTFNVTAIDATVQLYDYRYVVILCKPASVTFGYADLN